MRSRHVGWVLALALSACDPTDAPAPADSPVRPIAASASPHGRAAARVTAIEPGAGVLDERDGAVLYGLPSATRPADARHGAPLLRVKLLAASATSPEEVGDLQDAALATGGVVTLAPDGVLALRSAARLSPSGGPDTTPLDTQVKPGLSLSADGRWLAYAAGTAPELDVRVIDLGLDPGGARAPLTVAAHPAPDYLPALSADGTRVLFVSSRTGQPALWTAAVTAGATPTPVGEAPATSPDGRRPPLWAGGHIVFFDGQGVIVVDGRGRPVLSVPGAHTHHWLEPGERLGLVTDDGAYQAVHLTAQVRR